MPTKWLQLKARDLLGPYSDSVALRKLRLLPDALQWVRLSGVLTSVEEYDQRWLLTLDDGSGAAIQVVIRKESVKEISYEDAKRIVEDKIELCKWRDPPGASMRGVKRGSCVEVKGKLGQFRGVAQIEAEKLKRITNTEREVELWEVRDLMRRRLLSGVPQEAKRARVRRPVVDVRASEAMVIDREVRSVSRGSVRADESRLSPRCKLTTDRHPTENDAVSQSPAAGAQDCLLPEGAGSVRGALESSINRWALQPLSPSARQSDAYTDTHSVGMDIDIPGGEKVPPTETRAQRRRRNKKLRNQIAGRRKMPGAQDRHGRRQAPSHKGPNP